MSLLTPPNSSHRSDKDKENKFPEPVAGPSTRSVVWAAQNSIHCLGTPPKSNTISSRNRPGTTKSILKKSSQNGSTHLQVPPPPQQRATTPEPLDPLVDLHYLAHPVERILANGPSNSSECLHELIEGYNILASRLRSGVSDNTDADASWPLFQPLRKKSQEFVNAVVRDLGRALVDPLTLYASNDEEVLAGTPKFTLPSPQKSPTKKKDGMTAEQAKYARDLCVISHSVIRLLSVILSIPAIHSVFDGECPVFTVIQFDSKYICRQTTRSNTDRYPRNSIGRRATNTERPQNMRLGHLATPSSAPSCFCFATSRRQNRLCITSRYGRRTGQRRKERFCQ